MGEPKIHRKQDFVRQSIEEVGFEMLFKGQRCTTCRSGKCCLRIQTFIALNDIPNAANREAAKLLVQTGEWETVMLSTGLGIRIGEVYACSLCAPAAERAVAHGPSYVIPIFDRNYATRSSIIAVSG